MHHHMSGCKYNPIKHVDNTYNSPFLSCLFVLGGSNGQKRLWSCGVEVLVWILHLCGNSIIHTHLERQVNSTCTLYSRIQKCWWREEEKKKRPKKKKRQLSYYPHSHSNSHSHSANQTTSLPHIQTHAHNLNPHPSTSTYSSPSSSSSSSSSLLPSSIPSATSTSNRGA